VKVTGVDIAPNLVQRAQARAKAEGLNARFMEGDAEALPFDEASFDVVTSLVGAMFAPRPELVASELLRVCNRAARLPWSTGRRRVLSARCSRRFKVHCAPPEMGEEAVVQERLGYGISDLTTTRHMYTFTYPFSPAEVVEFLRQARSFRLMKMRP